jgi:hypothetical protein
MNKPNCYIFILLSVFIAFPAYAGEVEALKQKMLEARYSLYIMLDNGDKRGPDQQKRVKETADAVSAMLAGMKAPAGKEAQFKELDATWKAFKKTREEELVPLILARKQKEAEAVATGVQNDRFKKMMDLCDELEK